MHFRPPVGETTVLSYRAHDSFLPPFKLFAQLEEIGTKMTDLIVKLNPTFPSKHHATDVVVSFNPPAGIER
jgi:hypothetical protein